MPDATPTVDQSTLTLTGTGGGDLLVADTGALPAGIYDVTASVGGASAARWDIVHRDAANGADAEPRCLIYTPAGGARTVVLRVALEAGERVYLAGPVTPRVLALVCRWV